MYIDFLTLIVPFIIALTIVLQVVATRRVRRDASFAPEQRSMQLWLIWLVPVLGAALVLSVLHEEPRIDMADSDSDRSAQSHESP